MGLNGLGNGFALNMVGTTSPPSKAVKEKLSTYSWVLGCHPLALDYWNRRIPGLGTLGLMSTLLKICGK